jgi:nucleotide-binding universal stress UspA family protein
MFETVLWVTDGSTTAERALPAAKSLAQTYDARLVATHVPEIAGANLLAVSAAGETTDAKAVPQQQVEDLKRDGVKAEFASTEMTIRGAAHAIAGLAREVGADLIVVGTRGNSPLVRLLVDDVTQRLLDLAPCPVLAVPANDGGNES